MWSAQRWRENGGKGIVRMVRGKEGTKGTVARLPIARQVRIRSPGKSERVLRQFHERSQLLFKAQQA
ncbi:hypothetical protein Scep_004371 [Stephania cephalantha]|uniref:Uncharacterized protein n=1 Tax=Stephania cephalantha TaxID=152367 RepID=A0AAP0KSB8_9MAGN